MRGMRLLLIRHGQTPSNVQGVLDTAAPGPGLTVLGEQQAAAIPAALADRDVDAIAVSPLVRTSFTAAPLATARGLTPVIVDGLREVEAGDLEMESHHDAHQRYLGTVFAWARGDVSLRMPGGPDGVEFLGRYDEAVAQIASRGWETVVAFSHGAAIRSWASARVAGVDVDEVERTSLQNTGLVEIEGDPSRGWELVTLSWAPVGGLQLASRVAEDPTGEAIDR